MVLGSMDDAVDLGFKYEIDNKLKANNEDAMVRFYNAVHQNKI